MYHNLGALRDFCLSLRAWDNTGATFKERLRNAFQLAYTRIVGDVPKAFLPEQVHAILYEDVKGPDTSGVDTTTGAAILRRWLRRTTDPWVLEFVDDAGNPYPNAVPGGAWVPNVDATWDGVMHLELQDTAGKLYRRQSREWWLENDKDYAHYYVSLDRPWPAGSVTENLEFRIHQPKFYLPSRVMRILAPARIWDDSHTNMWPIAFSNAQTFQLSDYRGQSCSRPARFFRDEHFQIPAPNRAPTCSINNQDPWVGEENLGTFRFYYTRVWGKTPEEWQNSPGGTRDPVWESAPSPVSAAFTHTFPLAITITVPEIDWMQDFARVATLRYSHSGYRTRIYVARDEVQVGAPGLHPTVEKAGIPYLLVEIDGATTTYTWTGAVIPDYFRRLHHATGYYGYSVALHQDKEYVLDLQVVSLPDILMDDQDTPRLQPDAQPALVEILLHYMARMDGADERSADTYLKNYTGMVRNLRERYGNDGGIVHPIPFTGYSADGVPLASDFTVS
jgi:hypothetical protein